MTDVNASNIEERLDEWKQMSINLRALKAFEMEIRKDIVGFLQPSAIPGTFDHDNSTMRIKVKIGVNIKIDEELLEHYEEQLSDAELACIKHKPSIIAKNYKMVPSDDREMLDSCLIVTPAAPTLTVEYRDEPDA